MHDRLFANTTGEPSAILGCAMNGGAFVTRCSSPRGRLAMPIAADFEKLGVFYLGRPYDLAAAEGAGRPAPLRLEGPGHARGLRRHDRQRQDRPVPGAARRGGASTASRRSLIDPKGDLANLLLTFPELEPEDFRPWIDEDDARRQGPVAPTSTPRQQAELWQKGLADWGAGRRAHPAAARRGRLRDLHARQQRGHAALDAEVVRGPAARHPRGRASCCASGSATTVTGLLGLARHRRRPDQEPRAHPALDDPRHAAWRTAGRSTWPA